MTEPVATSPLVPVAEFAKNSCSSISEFMEEYAHIGSPPTVLGCTYAAGPLRLVAWRRNARDSETFGILLLFLLSSMTQAHHLVQLYVRRLDHEAGGHPDVDPDIVEVTNGVQAAQPLPILRLECNLIRAHRDTGPDGDGTASVDPDHVFVGHQESNEKRSSVLREDTMTGLCRAVVW